MEQTAVDWLEKELKDRYSLLNSEPLFEQAKEMEKQRMIEFGSKVAEKWGLTTVEAPYIEKFYNETYGKQ